MYAKAYFILGENEIKGGVDIHLANVAKDFQHFGFGEPLL